MVFNCVSKVISNFLWLSLLCYVINSRTCTIFDNSQPESFITCLNAVSCSLHFCFSITLLSPSSYYIFKICLFLHSYNTRNSDRKFYIFPCRTNFRKFSIRFQGPKFFNSPNQEIQDSESISLFSKRLKTFLLI